MKQVKKNMASGVQCKSQLEHWDCIPGACQVHTLVLDSHHKCAKCSILYLLIKLTSNQGGAKGAERRSSGVESESKG